MSDQEDVENEEPENEEDQNENQNKPVENKEQNTKIDKNIEEVNNAPVITPLLRFSNTEREKLLYNLFLQAKNTIESLKLNTTPEEKNKMIYKESDRLLSDWMETNKNTYRTDL